MEVPPGAVKDSFAQVFIYENLKTGKQEKISYNDLMNGKVNDETQWKWVETKSDKVREGYKPPIHDFRITKGEDTTNLTPKFLAEKGYRLMIVQYNVEKSHARVQDKLNSLVTDLQKEGKVKVWAFSGSSAVLNDWYTRTYKTPYEFYTVDGTALKTIIRSNPGLVLLKDNMVVAMWPSTALPDKEDIYKHMQ
jgi:triosephosphate isomerase